MSPSTTVVIPFFNAQKFLLNCLLSVAEQKSDFHFQILLINDGSTDRSLEIAQAFKNQFGNTLLIDLPKKGLVYALNYSLRNTQSRFITRHDADDLMMPDRIQNQMTTLLNNPEFNCIGSQISLLQDLSAPPREPNKYPINNNDIKRELLRRNAFASPTVTFCRNCALSVGGYRLICDGAEDYDLWLRMAEFGKMQNSTRELTMYRIHLDQVTQSKQLKVLRATLIARILTILNLKVGLEFPVVDKVECHVPSPRKKSERISAVFFLIIDIKRFLTQKIRNRLR